MIPANVNLWWRTTSFVDLIDRYTRAVCTALIRSFDSWGDYLYESLETIDVQTNIFTFGRR